MNTPICKQCGAIMTLIPAGVSKKTGKSYDSFWACPNSKICGGKTIPYVNEDEQVMKELDQGYQILKRIDKIDAKIDALDKRITEMAKWLAGKI